MNDRELEVLSALVDGEAVDADALATALARPEAADCLVEFVRWRASLRAAEADESWRAATVARLSGADGGGDPRRRGLRWAAAIAAAAALVVALLLPRTERETASPTQPPPPDRVLRFEPGVDWVSR